jgi:N-acetyl sugar amidotransferase
MSQSTYRVCSNCIMDTTDPGITFDERGWCDYCRNYYENIKPNWHPDERGARELAPTIEKIRESGKDRQYDCIVGISGGVDSSYVAYLAKEKFGLRPLVYHVDTGWNSQTSVTNIQKVVDGLGLDLHTDVIQWQEMKDLQVAFFKAQVANVDIPQELALFSSLYNHAVESGIKYVLTGANYSTECVREPNEWGAYYPTDLRYVKDVHRRFGQRPLKTFPATDIFTYRLYYTFIKGMKVVRPLNNVPYTKDGAIRLLTERFGWQPYAQKHYESRFTKFVESYWLPRKFGFDRRKAHLSSLILTNQLTRAAALERVATPELSEREMAQEFEYVAKKLDLTVAELQQLFEGKNKTYRDYKNKMPLITLGNRVTRLLRMERRVVR